MNKNRTPEELRKEERAAIAYMFRKYQEMLEEFEVTGRIDIWVENERAKGGIKDNTEKVNTNEVNTNG